MGNCKYSYGRKGDKQSARDVVWMFCVEMLKYEFFILIIWYFPNQKCITLTVTEIMVILNIWPLLKHLHILPCLQPFTKMSSYMIINILHHWHSIFPVRTWTSSGQTSSESLGISLSSTRSCSEQEWTSWQIFIPSERLGSASRDWQWFIQE